MALFWKTAMENMMSMTLLASLTYVIPDEQTLVMMEKIMKVYIYMVRT